MLGALLVGALALGCPTRREDASRLELWAMGREGEGVAALARAFEAHEPGVRVRVQQIPWSAAHEKLLTAHVGDAMPDVFQLGNTWVAEFVALGALEPLDARLAASARVRPEDFFPGLLEAVSLDGHVWAVPWYVDTRVLFYRSDLLAAAGVPAPPATWDGWVEALARVRARAGDRGFAILLPLSEWEVPVILALQRGAGLLRDGGRFGDFRSAAFRDAMAFYLSLFERGLAPPAGPAQVANLYQDFASGWFAVTVTGPWNLREFARRLPPALQDDWATAPIPALDERHPSVSIAGGASLAVHRGSPRKELAWRLVEFLAEPESQVAFHATTGDLPPGARAWEDPALRADSRAEAFRLQLAHLATLPRVPEWERIAAKIATCAEALVRGELALDPALARLDGEVDAVLARRRGLLERAAAGARR
jgi:multiple sugar transport system substrate-binding protein